MELHFIRHGIAVDRESPDVHSDEERWLTDEGIEKMKEIAKALCKIVPAFDVVFTSPLIRSRQTAELVARAFKKSPPITETALLSPGMDLKSLFIMTENYSASARLAFVGHEPDFSEMIALLIAGTAEARIDMKKGAVCRIDFEGPIAQGEGCLIWLLPPKVLRLLA